LFVNSSTLFEQCRLAARLDAEAPMHPDSLIGMFQAFRPDGIGLDDAFSGMPCAGDLFRRLERLYRDSGEDQRPQGGRDAYFVIRAPRPIDPIVAESTARQWLENLSELAKATSQPAASTVLSRDIQIRVLEGIAPKHPKDDSEKSELLKVFTNEVPELSHRLVTKSTPRSDCDFLDLLRPAYYFIACDASLRDYLMWPLYQPFADQINAAPNDPFSPYYDLWRHGIKYRIFSEDQIDLYLPRHG
jgi:hypothetical protein